MGQVIGDGDSAGRDRLGAIVEQRVTGPTAMPKLHENPATPFMHRGGDSTPGLDLHLIIQTGFGLKGAMPFLHHGGLGHDQAGAGPLAVIPGHQRCRNVIYCGPAPRVKGAMMIRLGRAREPMRSGWKSRCITHL